MASESGYSNQKKLGTAQFKTIHSVGGDKYGQSVASKALYEKTPEAVITVTEVLGNSGQIEFLNVNFPFHVADVNDILRMSAGTTKANFEFDILSIVDGDNFLILPIVEASQIDSNNASIMSWVTNKANSDGSQIVTLAPAPLQFVKDSSTIDVNEDTVTPANNVALPTGMFIYVDGVQVPISVDTGTPANTVGVPVIVTGAAGPINITAGDLNVQLTDQGVNADVTRIGDGTTQLAITVAGEAKVVLGDGSGNPIGTVTLPSTAIALSVQDEEALASLSSIDGKIISNGILDSGNSSGTPLGANAVYTGDAFDVTEYATINVNVVSDVASAADGVKVEFSGDGTNWVHSHATTYNGGSGIGYIFNCEWQFARVVYTNGPVAQGSFLVQTIFKANAVKQSLYTLDQASTGNMFAELGKNVIIGKTTGGGGGYVPVKVNPSGALTVEASGSVSVDNFPATQPISGSVSVDNFPATQAVSGTFWQATQPVSAAALPLPTGAATDAKLDSIITAIGSTNTKLDSIELDLSPEFSDYSTQSVFDTPAVTFTAPTGAKRMVIQNSLEASGPIRFTPSTGTPSASNGFYLGVGQSTSEIPAGTIEAIAVNSGEAGDVTVIWFI